MYFYSTGCLPSFLTMFYHCCESSTAGHPVYLAQKKRCVPQKTSFFKSRNCPTNKLQQDEVVLYSENDKNFGNILLRYSNSISLLFLPIVELYYLTTMACCPVDTVNCTLKRLLNGLCMPANLGRRVLNCSNTMYNYCRNLGLDENTRI